MNASQQKEDRLTLEVLSAVEGSEDISQRRLANQMGVALGLANSYMKRCVRKGLIKINEAPANRYAYYLTPKGFTEKSRLTARFLSCSLDFYRKAADSCSQLFRQCEADGATTVVLCGDSEFAEIAFLRALEEVVDVAGLYDPDCMRSRFYNRPVWRDLDDVEPLPRVITGVDDPRRWRRDLRQSTPGIAVYMPDVLEKL